MHLVHNIQKLFNFCLKAFFQLMLTCALTLRPLLGPVGCCRFQPTCTRYAQEQLTTQNPLVALYNIILRVLLCQPLGKFFTQK